MPPPSKPAYFWWLLANAMALCFAIVSWALCLHVFGNPEIPRNYEILRKLGRLPEMKRYTVLDVPNSTSLGPRELYKKFHGLDEEQVIRVNTLLMRNYITNFERPLLLTYIEGDYQITDIRTLGEGDFLSPGFAIRAQAMVKPDDFTAPAPFPLVIEYLFPSEADASFYFEQGDILTVKKSPNCAAVVHVGTVLVEDDPALCLTVIPIAYGPYQIGDARSFNIEPPTRVNPAGGFPVFKP